MDGDVLIFSNLGHLMNDPRYASAGGEVDAWLDQGVRKVVIELSDVHETGHAFLGLLVGLTRRIRQGRGDVVLARVSRAVRGLLQQMERA
jgi:ABC-type transporter Mla MlaB component